MIQIRRDFLFPWPIFHINQVLQLFVPEIQHFFQFLSKLDRINFGKTILFIRVADDCLDSMVELRKLIFSNPSTILRQVNSLCSHFYFLMVLKVHVLELNFDWREIALEHQFKCLNRKRIYKERDWLKWINTVGIEDRDITFVLYFNGNTVFLPIETLLIILVRFMSVHQIFEILLCIKGDDSVRRTIKLDSFKLASFFDSDFDLLAGERTIDFAAEWLSEWFRCEAMLDSWYDCEGSCEWTVRVVARSRHTFFHLLKWI